MASYGQLENKKYELIILVEGKIDRPVPLSEFMLSIVEQNVKYLSQRVKNQEHNDLLHDVRTQD